MIEIPYLHRSPEQNEGFTFAFDLNCLNNSLPDLYIEGEECPCCNKKAQMFPQKEVSEEI